MPNDPLFPLAASVITKDLPSDKRLALTAAATVIPGALALGPAMVALERSREAAAAAPAAAPQGAQPQQPGQPQQPAAPKVVKPPLRRVPRVLGKTEQLATERLKKAGFGANVDYRYDEQGRVDQVIAQNPDENTMLEEGLKVQFTVAQVAEPVPDQTTDQRLTALEVSITRLDERIEALPTLEDLKRIFAGRPGAGSKPGAQPNAAPPTKPGG